MNFRDVLPALESLVYRHPLAGTNLIAISNDRTDVIFETDSSHYEEEIDDLKEENAQQAKDLKDSDAVISELEEKVEKAESLLDEFRHGGRSVKEFVEEAEAAKDLARSWQTEHNAMQAELTALRKRKGIHSNVVRHAHDINTLLRYIAESEPKHFARYRQTCADMYAKINTP